MFEESHLELRPQHPPDATVDVPDVDCAPLHLGRQHVTVPVGVGHLDVQAGCYSQSASVTRVGGHPLTLDELIDGGVVGGDEAVEPEGVAQQVLQYLWRGAGGDAVDVRIGVHHRPQTCEADRRLEGVREQVPRAAGAGLDAEVFSPPGGTA